MKTVSSIEPLEARIAPASLNAAGTILTYTDIDGDAVKVTFTGTHMVASDFGFSVGFGSDAPQALNEINLTDKTGAGFTLTATPQAGQGDSHANVHYVGGPNTDLGAISVDGDVVTFDAGTGAPGTVGLKSFTALSIGQNLIGSASSTLKNVGSFTVKHDVSDVALTFTGGVKSLSIGGNLQEFTGTTELKITGDVGSLKIGGSVIARNGTQPSILITNGSVGTFSIGGSLIGGNGDLASGYSQIAALDVKTFSIGGDLRGGAGQGGGAVTIGGDDGVGTARIGGSLIGTDDVIRSGLLKIYNDVKSVTIGGSILGGDATSKAVTDNGALQITGNVGTLKLGHDLIGGSVNGNGGTLPFADGMISVDGIAGSVTIGGSVSGDSTHVAYLSFGGGFTTATVAAVKTLNIKGSVTFASLLAGYYQASNIGNLDSGFGSVTIGGSLSASFIVAGSNSGADGIPGNTDDTVVSHVATIGSVKIGGAFRGIASTNTNYYIYAPIVNKLTVGKASYDHADLLGGVEFYAIGKATALSVG